MGRPKNFEPDAVIAQAMEAFWTNGYAGTSPADLAEATGVAKGSLYHAFGSKRELFGKALELYGRTGSAMTEELLARPSPTKECIRDYLILIVDTDLTGPVRRGCLGTNTALELGGRDEEATQAVHRMGQRTIQLLTERIEQGLRDGDVAPEVDARVQAQFLLSTIVGLRVMSKTFDRATLYGVIDTALAGL